jgi:hypothetical protein
VTSYPWLVAFNLTCVSRRFEMNEMDQSHGSKSPSNAQITNAELFSLSSYSLFLVAEDFLDVDPICDDPDGF